MAARVVHSTGNIFLDIGFPKEDAAHLLIRSDLMIQLEKLIKGRKLTQKKAATVLGVTQPRISDLMRGKIDLFSIDTLVGMLARLDVTVTVSTKAKAKRRSRAA